jgi:hypothetical protein
VPNQFNKREAATRELAKLVDLAKPLLRETLAGEPFADAKQRIEQLLQNLSDGALPIERERALEALEQSGSAEAHRLMESLAKGAPDARRTKQAKVALERLAKRCATAP